MSLKIAFVVHDYNRHMGHSAYVAELATRMKQDHEVHIFADTFEEPDPSRLQFHRVRAWRRTTLTTILSFVPSATAVVRGEFDIVHSQGLCGLRHDVATAHFCQSAWFDALQGADFRLNWKQRLFQSLVTPLERRALTQPSTKRVIAVSKRIKNDLSRYYGRERGVQVIYHGVDAKRFHPENRGRFRSEIRNETKTGEDDFVAIYVGDLQKGALAAIRAVAQTPGVTLWCVSASKTAAYADSAAQLGVADRVRFFPRTKQVEQFFAAADVFVFPTICDPFGLVITEAMASGLPVITSRAAGASELIQSNVSGLLTDQAWDAEAIAAHLADLRDNVRRRESIGEAARRTIEPFTWDQTVAQTLDVYHSLVRER